MNDQAMHVSGPAVPRLLSLDVLRGIIILAMLFVNDISEVRGTPAWLRHTPTHLDGMTFVDLVFPAFLFMVGMAMPFAFERRLASGEPLKKIWGHVALRSAALVIIGFLMVNAEEMVEGGLLPPVIWQLLMYGGVLLLWAGYGNWKTDHPVRVKSLRLSGGLLLVAAACLYQGRAGGGVLALRPYYWGIIGLIG